MYSQLLLKTPNHQFDSPTSSFEPKDSVPILYIKNPIRFEKNQLRLLSAHKHRVKTALEKLVSFFFTYYLLNYCPVLHELSEKRVLNPC